MSWQTALGTTILAMFDNKPEALFYFKHIASEYFEFESSERYAEDRQHYRIKSSAISFDLVCRLFLLKRRGC